MDKRLAAYFAELQTLRARSTKVDEQQRRPYFLKLIEAYLPPKLTLVAELSLLKSRKVPDASMQDGDKLSWGYYEAKDSKDNLEKEIQLKFNAGYPNSNILFEDGLTAILYQDGKLTQRVHFADKEGHALPDTHLLEALLQSFVSYEPAFIEDYHEAVAIFKKDAPRVVASLRREIAEATEKPEYIALEAQFLSHLHQVVNPEVSGEDVREMLVQHLLTEDIFYGVYGDKTFHRTNNIAIELNKLTQLLDPNKVKDIFNDIRRYYRAIERASQSVASHDDRQKFLKVLFETFYKAYNPEKADTLGIVYTPNEIVQFMVRSVDELLQKHFNKTRLWDDDVQILDPATGTGTFIAEIINYLAYGTGPFVSESRAALPEVYKERLHANEIAVLPYYIANLNIEATYREAMGNSVEYENLCLVDTLENIAAIKHIRDDRASELEFTQAFSPENAERIKNLNNTPISVIIGNPPYNAKQALYNNQNPNKWYTFVSTRIKETYAKGTTAVNKQALHDMYVRFFSWATDRLDKKAFWLS